MHMWIHMSKWSQFLGDLGFLMEVDRDREPRSYFRHRVISTYTSMSTPMNGLAQMNIVQSMETRDMTTDEAQLRADQTVFLVDRCSRHVWHFYLSVILHKHAQPRDRQIYPKEQEHSSSSSSRTLKDSSTFSKHTNCTATWHLQLWFAMNISSLSI